jgi:hypothetical protein
MLGDRGDQLVGAPSRARHVDDDRRQRHQNGSYSRASYGCDGRHARPCTHDGGSGAQPATVGPAGTSPALVRAQRPDAGGGGRTEVG